MSDQPTDDVDDPTAEEPTDTAGSFAATPVTATYKVLGQLDADSGVGVLGQNDADSGTPIGVQGAVPNDPTGFGLATPDDARIQGVIDTSETDFVVDAGTTTTQDARNVVLGHASNSATSGVVGGVVGGGGFDDGALFAPNTVTADYATVGGGEDNTASGPDATVGGGEDNTASADWATVGGGISHEAGARYATVGGGNSNAASGTASTIGGGRNNTAGDFDATVAGGDHNTASGTEATVGGGQSNVAKGQSATVGGGEGNAATGDFATVGGGGGAFGDGNTASGERATVGGGEGNAASNEYATVAGGQDNEVLARKSTIGGGFDNRVGTSGSVVGRWATVPGGVSNAAEADYAFAAGDRAKARDQGAFVWADHSFADFASDQTGTSGSPTGANTFHARATGGVRFVTGLDSNDDPNAGAYLASGGSSWNAVSARSVKHDVRPVDPRSVLEGVESLTVSRWAYDANPGVDRMGPMAGEFSDTFELGDDPETIGHVDADGVALAAIQGLSERLTETRSELADAREELDRKGDRIDALEAENETLRERLADVETHLGLDRGTSIRDAAE